MKNKPERWIAISVILCAACLMIALGLVLGRFQLPNSQRRLVVNFATVTGITLNAPVKYAGAQVGRVRQIRVLHRKEEVTQDNIVYCVQIDLELDPTLELGDDLRVAIKQDGLLGSRYIALVPGRADAAPLDPSKTLVGENPVELDDLLPMAENMIANLKPTLDHLNSISGQMDSQLPQLMTDLDSLLNGGSGIVGAVNTPESRTQLVKVISNLGVITDNLKVVTTQAKGITSTLGQKPWQLIWGGVPNKIPTEAEILKADKPLPINATAINVNDGDKLKVKTP